MIVPKYERANKDEDFRPISLCNVIYQILPNILATKLWSIMQNIISHMQAIFFKGQNIQDYDYYS